MKAVLALIGVLAFGLSEAYAAPLAFVKLTGDVGGAPAETAVYKADLSGVGFGSILSITIADNSGGIGGATGMFSGFDLDAIKLSTTDCATAACASAAVGTAAFDFSPAGTLFTPGTQRVPVDPKLFGTGPGGNTVDNAVATLALFDANSTTGPGAFGFLSMGDGGVLSFNLIAAVSTAGMFLYIGEVGDNGEVAAGRITVSQVPVPEPGVLSLVGLGLAACVVSRFRSRHRR